MFPDRATRYTIFKGIGSKAQPLVQLRPNFKDIIDVDSDVKLGLEDLRYLIINFLKKGQLPPVDMANGHTLYI
ncbi:hypothetical protein A3Q56_03283 [Intoshia linei]|uniref:Uncharacterized protein n=1 Tax=Intoshia linei TaxID=1819745 RepID=A0A177B5T1_9BILA|nr:hypothetical protein A3Q56_03283 [Intoshia linei]